MTPEKLYSLNTIKEQTLCHFYFYISSENFFMKHVNEKRKIMIGLKRDARVIYLSSNIFKK